MTKYKSDTPYLDKVIKEYLKGTQKFYPNFQFSSRHSFNFGGSEPLSCELELSFRANSIVGTEYEVKEKTDLIHYTSSVQNVIEILNSGYFRLSNLVALNDPQEIGFIIKNLNLRHFEGDIKNFKSTFFSSSFCRFSTDQQQEDFPMWRLYGNDGFGSAIVFEIMNFGNDWSNFTLSQVQYGENLESVKRFNDFMEFHNNFQNDNNHPFQNNPITVSSITALHKNKIWEYEKEIRLLSHNEFDEYSLKDTSSHICELKHSISKNNVNYSYIELPLFGSKEYKRIVALGHSDTLSRLLPILRIKEVILGYRISTQSYSDIINVINNLSEKYQYAIAIKDSPLKEFMI